MDKFNVPPFNFKSLPSSRVRDEWLKYKRNFEYIALANEEKNQTKLKYIFLAKAGPDVQEVFGSLQGADVVEDAEKTIKPFDVAISKLDEYFAPQQHETFERYMFWTLNPTEGESLEKFLLRATEQASKCNFGSSKEESTQISVIDKLILLAPPELKEQLLQKENLTLTELTKMINSYSSVKYQATQMTSASTLAGVGSASSINRLQASSSTSAGSLECSRCGWRGHLANDAACPARNKSCDKCGKVGHFAKRCKSVQGFGKRHAGTPNSDSKRRRINAIDLSDDNIPQTEEYSFIYNICDREEIIPVRVGGILVEMMIDSGSVKNLIDEQTWQRLLLQGMEMKNPRDKCHLTFRPYGQNSEPLRVVKVFEASVSVFDSGNELKTDATFFVVEAGSQAILGKETAKALGVLIIGLPSTHTTVINSIEANTMPFPKIKGVKLCIPINKEVSPVAQHARRPPLALLTRIEEKLDGLLKQDIIESVDEYSQWVSPLVAIVKDNGDLRLCVDMRRANEAILRENHPMPTFEDFMPRLRNAKFFSRLDVKDAFHQVELDESCR